MRIRQRAELVAVDAAALHQALKPPDPSPSARPWPTASCFTRDGVGVARVRLQAGNRAVVARRWSSPSATSAPVSSRTSTSRRAVRLRPAADRIAARRMHPLQIVVVHELRAAVGARPEVERAPGDQRGLVRQPGEVDVRFGVEFRHTDLYIRHAAGAPAQGCSLMAGRLRLRYDRLPHQSHGCHPERRRRLPVALPEESHPRACRIRSRRGGHRRRRRAYGDRRRRSGSCCSTCACPTATASASASRSRPRVPRCPS